MAELRIKDFKTFTPSSISYNNLLNKPDLSSLHSHDNKSLLDDLVSNGDGESFLANDGTYKAVSGGSGLTSAQVLAIGLL